MKKLLLIFVLHFSLFSFGQGIADSSIAQFCNIALEDYFDSANTPSKNNKFNSFLIETEFDTSLLLQTGDSNKLIFFNAEQGVKSLLDKPYKNHNGRSVYTLKYQIFNEDTVDIVIHGYTIDNIKKKSMSIGVWCGGTLGYIPIARFVRKESEWTYLSFKELIELKFKKD
jgi:hypothetical protein